MEMTSSARGRSHFPLHSSGWNDFVCARQKREITGVFPIAQTSEARKNHGNDFVCARAKSFSLHSSGWNDFVCARQEREITGFLFPSGVGGTRKQFVSKGVLCGYPLDSGIPRPGGDLETSPPSIPRGIFFPSNRFVSFPRRSISSKGFKP